jgi:hypothetical protein
MRLFTAGDRVSQAQYGHGTVLRANEYHTQIEFDEHGLRTFSTRDSHLEESATVAPVKPPQSKRGRVKKPVQKS